MIRSYVWKRQKLDNHAWAFIHFCRRKGDEVKVFKKVGGYGDIKVIIRNER